MIIGLALTLTLFRASQAPTPTPQFSPRAVLEQDPTLASGLRFHVINGTKQEMVVYGTAFYANHAVNIYNEVGHEMPLSRAGQAARQRLDAGLVRDGNIKFKLQPGQSFSMPVQEGWEQTCTLPDGVYIVRISLDEKLEPNRLRIQSNAIAFRKADGRFWFVGDAKNLIRPSRRKR